MITFEQTEVKALFKPQKWTNIPLSQLIVSTYCFLNNFSFNLISLFSLSRYKLRYPIRESLLFQISIQRRKILFSWMLLKITKISPNPITELFLISSYWNVLWFLVIQNSCLQWWVSKSIHVRLADVLADGLWLEDIDRLIQQLLPSLEPSLSASQLFQLLSGTRLWCWFCFTTQNSWGRDSVWP